jgi:hypothetical protein
LGEWSGFLPAAIVRIAMPMFAIEPENVNLQWTKGHPIVTYGQQATLG